MNTLTHSQSMKTTSKGKIVIDMGKLFRDCGRATLDDNKGAHFPEFIVQNSQGRKKKDETFNDKIDKFSTTPISQKVSFSLIGGNARDKESTSEKIVINDRKKKIIEINLLGNLRKERICSNPYYAFDSEGSGNNIQAKVSERVEYVAKKKKKPKLKVQRANEFTLKGSLFSGFSQLQLESQEMSVLSQFSLPNNSSYCDEITEKSEDKHEELSLSQTQDTRTETGSIYCKQEEMEICTIDHTEINYECLNKEDDFTIYNNQDFKNENIYLNYSNHHQYSELENYSQWKTQPVNTLHEEQINQTSSNPFLLNSCTHYNPFSTSDHVERYHYSQINNSNSFTQKTELPTSFNFNTTVVPGNKILNIT